MLSIYVDKSILIYSCFVAALLGASMGSFLNCAAWRSVRGESFLHGRSRCPSCGRTLGAAELVPVFGWLLLRGRCRGCGTRISVRYPLTELAFAGVTVLCLLRFDLTALCLRNWLFLCCLFFLSLTDLDSHVIPDGCLILAALAWLAALPLLRPGWGAAWFGLLAALVYGGGTLAVSLVMDRVLGRESMGGGDVKLLAVTGLYLGMIGGFLSLVLACMLGLLLGPALRRNGEREFPFGPAIAAASAIILLYGDGAAEWYRRLLYGTIW